MCVCVYHVFLFCYYFVCINLCECVTIREIPLELRHAVKDGEVHVEIEDHRKEPFQPPKKKMQAFTGEGHKLGKYVQINLFLCICLD